MNRQIMQNNGRSQIFKTSLFVSLFCICVFFTVLFIRSITAPNARASEYDTLTNLSFDGTYSVDGSSPETLTSRGIVTDFSKKHTVILTGHFLQDIPEGKRMMFKIKYLAVRMIRQQEDGGIEELFSYGDRSSRPPFRRSGGFLYFQTDSPGISYSDNITIVLSNTTTLDSANSFRIFLDSMYAGSVHELFLKEFRHYWIYPVSGSFFIAAGFILLLLLAFTKLDSLGETECIAALAFLAIVGGIWNSFIYELFSLIIPYPALADLIAYTCYYLIAALIPLFFSSILSTVLRHIARCISVCAFAGTAAALILQDSGIADLFGTVTHIFLVYYSIILPFLFGCVIYEAACRRNRNASFLLISSVPFLLSLAVSAGISLFHPTSASYPVELICSGFFFISQIIFIFRRINKTVMETMRLQNMEKTITENRVRVMMSEIQPHFLYNALSVIKGLTMIDTDKAGEAIDNFALYLRGNMDSISEPGLTPFSKELEHTKEYLFLEQLRFGSRLHIKYDLETEAFIIPPLTLQPLVENAVRYGVTKKEEGGTVTISVRKHDESVMVIIEDDGAGFSIDEKRQTVREHSGIYNVRERLRMQCGGDLIISSTPGKGTKAVIMIPLHAEDKTEIPFI